MAAWERPTSASEGPPCPLISPETQPRPQVRGFHTARPLGRGEQVKNRMGVTISDVAWRLPSSASSTWLGSIVEGWPHLKGV